MKVSFFIKKSFDKKYECVHSVIMVKFLRYVNKGVVKMKVLKVVLAMTICVSLMPVQVWADDMSEIKQMMTDMKKDYESLKYSTREIETHLHKLYSLPFFVSIMTIITSIIMFNNKRKTSFVFHLILGILFSVIIYYFYYLFNLLGENGKMPIILSIYLIITLIICIQRHYLI